MKILYVTTISKTVNAFLLPHINMLRNEGHQVEVACNKTEDLLDPTIKLHDISFQRTPICKDNFIAYKKLLKLVDDLCFDIVHTHTPVASVITRLVCKYKPHTKVFYTAHGFHFHNSAPLKNWLFYYPIEFWLSKHTDTLITINQEDYNRANKKFRVKNIHYIPGVGFDVSKFGLQSVDKLRKRNELQVSNDAFLLCSVGELNKNKNHEVVIRAVAQLNDKNINYVIAGVGTLKGYLQSLIKELNLEDQIKLLGYRKDIAEINMISDVFIFPSKREGLGVAALEAMATGLPLIASNVHGVVDYLVDNVNGLGCDPNRVDDFANAIKKLQEDSDLRKSMSLINIENACKYDITNVLSNLKEIYNIKE